MTAHVKDKARRLLNEGRVSPPQIAAVVTVEGDHGTYQVVVGEGIQTCSCESRGHCSHIAAAVERITVGSIEAGVLDAAYEARRARRAREAEALLARLGA